MVVWKRSWRGPQRWAYGFAPVARAHPQTGGCDATLRRTTKNTDDRAGTRETRDQSRHVLKPVNDRVLRRARARTRYLDNYYNLSIRICDIYLRSKRDGRWPLFASAKTIIPWSLSAPKVRREQYVFLMRLLFIKKWKTIIYSIIYAQSLLQVIRLTVIVLKQYTYCTGWFSNPFFWPL